MGLIEQPFNIKIPLLRDFFLSICFLLKTHYQPTLLIVVNITLIYILQTLDFKGISKTIFKLKKV